MGLLLESIRVALAARLQFVLVVVLATVGPLTVLAVAGLGIEAQGAVLGRLDDVGARVIVISSANGTPVIPPDAVARIGSMAGVSWVIGLGPVVDVQLRSGGGRPTPMRVFVGLRAPVQFSAGAAGDVGFVSAESARRLGVRGAYGVVDPGSVVVGGWFSASPPLEGLGPFLLLQTTDRSAPLERVMLAMDDAGLAPVIAANLPTLLGSDAASAASVELSPALIDARLAVVDEVARQSRALVVAALAGTTILCAAVIFMGTLAGQRDFGRRRALGASQLQLTVLVMLATVWPAMTGAVIGTAIGWAYTTLELGRLPDPRFPLAVGWLAFVSVVGSSALPALLAATRDPLRVLRVP